MTLTPGPPSSAGITAPRWSAAADAAAPFLSATLLVGVTGAIITQGHDGLAYTLGIAGAAFLWVSLIAPLLASLPAERSLPAFLAQRYSSPLVGSSTTAVLALALSLLLTAEITLIATIASTIIRWQISTTVVATVLAVIVLPLMAAGTNSRGVIWIAAAILLALLISLAALSGHDGPGALISVPTLADIAILEQGLLEKKLADPATFKPYASPFLRTDTLNTLALITCLSLGLASLTAARAFPAAAQRNPGRSRARALALVTCVLILVPAIAAAGRRSLLAVVASGLKADALPDWLLSLRSSGAIQICGTSAGDASAIVKACGKGAGPQGFMRWQDVTFAPDGQLFAALASSPLGAAASYLLALSAAMAAIWTAREIVRTLAGTLLPSNQSGANQTGSTITIAAIVLALAALFLTTNPAPSATLLAWSASLAAAALAPVLFAAFVPRPSAPAALIAIPLGAATVLILILTARYNPFDAFAMSSALSGAPPAVIRKMASLLQTLDAVSVETARQTVHAQIETLARDGITWFGLKPLSCGAIGLALSSAVMAAGTALNAMKLQPD